MLLADDKSSKEDCKSEKHQREQGEEKTNSEIRKSLRKKTKQKKQSSFPKEDNKQKCQWIWVHLKYLNSFHFLQPSKCPIPYANIAMKWTRKIVQLKAVDVLP